MIGCSGIKKAAGDRGPQALRDYISAARQMQIIRLPRDVRLTRQRLAPVRTELLQLARCHRRDADACFKQMSAPCLPGNEFQIDVPDQRQPYPLGYCRQIRDRVWDRLSDEPLARSLRKKGLTWKKVYFIQEGREFQNAIQCGDWLLDVAHDTVDPSQEPVVLAPLDELVWENLDDWHRFTEVAADYYRLTVYPNLYFPLLFPLIPFLAVRATGHLEFLYNQQMLFFLDLGDKWRRIRAVLEDQNLMARTLPPKAEQRLLELAGSDAAPFPVELRKCSAEELAETLREWEQIRGLSDAQAVATLQNFEKLASRAARKLRQAQVILDF